MTFSPPTKPAPSAASRRHAADLSYMLALLTGTIVVAAVPWISIGFLK
jgi:hypothetical protein